MQLLGATLTTGVLFSLFQVKEVEKGKWISLTSQSRKKVFKLFTFNFKRFRDQLFKALASEHEFPFFLDEKGHAKFSLYWNRFPNRVLSVDYHSLPTYDQVALDFLFFCTISQTFGSIASLWQITFGSIPGLSLGAHMKRFAFLFNRFVSSAFMGSGNSHPMNVNLLAIAPIQIF